MMNRIIAGCVSLLFFIMHDTGRARGERLGTENIKLPPVAASTLANGIRIFYIRDELPLITIVARVGFGRLYEKKEAAGMSDLIAKTLSLAGSKKYPGNALHETVDSMGGKLHIESSWEQTIISIKVLERFKGEAFAIISDLMRNPNFELQYFNTARALLSDSLKRKYEDPAEVAFAKAREIIFSGDGYGSYPTPQSVDSLTLDHALRTWREYFCGRNIMVGIYSSLPGNEAARLAGGAFSSIEAGAKETYAVDTDRIVRAVRDARGTIYLYPRDIPQSTIVIGTVAPRTGYAGNYSLDIMNYVLGGGSFNSRLMNEIRVKRGLAYAVQSVMRPRYKTGVFLAYAQTENKNVGEVLSILKKNIDIVSRENMRAGEIEWAKTAICNSFIFQFDTPLNILSNYMDIAYNNLPDDYYTRYLDHIRAVRDSDIVRETGRLFQHGTVTVVVGGKGVSADLEKFGRVVILK